MDQDWNQQLTREHKYQVWITSFPTDRESVVESPKQILVGQYDFLDDAVNGATKYREYEAVVTRVVEYKTTIEEVN